eukprot:6846808-Ditylum_brightwellii.AAC.1
MGGLMNYIKQTYVQKINDETIAEYDDEVKKLIAYSTNAKTTKHYQRYKKQYHSKLKLDSL